MARDLKARIKALESDHVDEGKVGGVLQLLRGESIDEALARAAKEGRTGGFLVVPPVLTTEEWLEAARELHRIQQERRQKFATAAPGSDAALCVAVAPDARDLPGYE